MRRIVYVDVYFILNFMFNLFLITLTAYFRQHYKRWKRWAGTSLLMAFFSTALLFICRGNQFFMALSVPLQLFLFLYISFGYEGLRGFFKDFVTFFLSACLSGGVITALLHLFQGERKGNSIGWLLLAFLCLFLCMFFLRLELLGAMQRQKNVCLVRLFFHGKSVEAKALYDTGNQLVSPYTGEGVVIVSKHLAEKLEFQGENLQLIPYRSIGGSGLLEAFRIDAIEMIEKGERKEHVLAAVSDSLKESSEIQVILNLRNG